MRLASRLESCVRTFAKDGCVGFEFRGIVTREETMSAAAPAPTKCWHTPTNCGLARRLVLDPSPADDLVQAHRAWCRSHVEAMHGGR